MGEFMKKKYTDEEKLQIINEAKTSGNILSTSRRYGISDGTIHTWIKKSSVATIKTNNTAQQEIKKLKKIIADKELENAILKDLVKKTVQVWTNEDQSLMNTSPSDIQKRKF